MRTVRFAEVPLIGTALLIEKQRFDLTDIVDHQRRDGTPAMLAVWKSHCADCGEPFQTRSPVLRLPEGRRCTQHQKPGTKAKGPTP